MDTTIGFLPPPGVLGIGISNFRRASLMSPGWRRSWLDQVADLLSERAVISVLGRLCCVSLTLPSALDQSCRLASERAVLFLYFGRLCRVSLTLPSAGDGRLRFKHDWRVHVQVALEYTGESWRMRHINILCSTNVAWRCTE